MSSDKLVVTRHEAFIEYLREQDLIGPDPEIRRHVTKAQVLGKHVIGVLPFHIAQHAEKVTHVPINRPHGMPSGKELTLQELREFAGDPQTYKVRRVYG